MSGLFRKNALVVSIFCALLEMGVSLAIVYASGMALEYEASQGDVRRSSLTNEVGKIRMPYEIIPTINENLES